ncbi:MAG: 4Fe-4S binding protein [Christensenellales bacterium]|jgi:MinD superfamily P-loop ATPase
MNIAILSGKGGTGKTLVSVNLAAAGAPSAYIDCDVEEPNGHLFFKPENVQQQKITVKIPTVDDALCDGCRKCVDFCKFNALAYIKDRLVIFEEMCHSCGGCVLLCPQKALTEKEKVIGKIEEGVSRQVAVRTGILNTGEASGVPIIKKMLEKGESKPNGPALIDCPPGSACVVMESIKDADYCILVAEPTLFGVHNLNMVYELVRLFHKPFGVVLNKCLAGENPSEQYCADKGIRILCRIPFDHALGLMNSNAEVAAWKDKKYAALFSSLLKTVIKEVQHEATAHT